MQGRLHLLSNTEPTKAGMGTIGTTVLGLLTQLYMKKKGQQTPLLF